MKYCRRRWSNLLWILENSTIFINELSCKHHLHSSELQFAYLSIDEHSWHFVHWRHISSISSIGDMFCGLRSCLIRKVHQHLIWFRIVLWFLARPKVAPPICKQFCILHFYIWHFAFRMLLFAYYTVNMQCFTEFCSEFQKHF